MQEADVVVALCQVALELRDRGIGLGQLLADGAGPLVRRERERPLAARSLDGADIVIAHRRGRSGIE